MASKSSLQQEPEKAEVIEEALEVLDKTLDRVKVLYEQYFLGIQKQAPAYLHTEVERKIRDIAQLQIRNTALRYRFATTQQKFGSYNSYWRRTLRQIENGTYGRNLSKIGRQAAKTGEAIPEEILAAMPKRMREQVRRDREAALAVAGRRNQAAEKRADSAADDYELLTLAPLEPTPSDEDDIAAYIREPSELRRKVLSPQGPHVIDEADASMDLDAFFASVAEEVEEVEEKTQPISIRTPVRQPAPSPPSAPPPAAAAPLRAASLGIGARSASPPPPPARTGLIPSVPRPGQPGQPGQPGPGRPGQPTAGDVARPPVGQPEPGQAGKRPPFGQPGLGTQPGVGPAGQPRPGSGQRPVAGEVGQPQRSSFPGPSQQPVAGEIGQRPSAGHSQQPIAGEIGSRPSAGRPGASQPPVAGEIGQPRPSAQARQPIPRPDPAQFGAIPAPSQVTRPIPIAAGASAAREAVPVETMDGPFPRVKFDRPDTDVDGAKPAPPAQRPLQPQAQRPLPKAPPLGPRAQSQPPARVQPQPQPRTPSQPQALRPPPGMSDADVNALYAKYVKAKEMVGETAGPGAYGKLLKTINAQAPKIMEQYNAKGVDFSVVVKDNQVIIRAKPKA